MDLGEIFATTWGLIRRTFSNAALLSIIIIFILGLLFNFGMRSYLTTMADFSASGGLTPQDDPELAQQMATQVMGAVIPFMFVTLIYFFGLIFVQVMATIASWEAINDRSIGMGELFRRSFSRPFWISVLQTIMFGVILAAAFFLLIIILYIIAGGNQEMLQSMMWLILIPLIYPIIATIFRIHKVAIEDRGPWQGMIASIVLVKGSWWKTFGTLVLLWVAMAAVSFLIGMATGGGDLSAFGGSMSAGSNDPEAAAAALASARDAYTIPYMIANSFISSILFTFFFYILTPMYVDLRARRGEFLSDEEMAEYEGE
jgi:hypothetical protein